MRKTAFITGATSGIGEATARLFAKSGINLVICGRRAKRLELLKEELSNYSEVQTLLFDVRYQSEVQKAFETLPDDFKSIDILINNAGNAHGLSPIQEGSLDDWDAMIDSNVKGLLYITKAILPQMIARQVGQIINIGSIAGKEAYPRGNVYCASKAAVDSFTQGLRLDTNSHGLRIGAIHPGLVETEFSEVRFKVDA